MILFRLFTILRVFSRYRLDQLPPKEHMPWHARWVLAVFSLLPNSSLSRGERLRRALEELGPIFVKFGQLLSTRPDLVPDDIVIELNQLQDRVTPFDKHAFREIVEKALGNSVDHLFATFDAEPLASASIAQVHAATLHDGREVVVKVVRPNLAPTIEKDMALMLKLAQLLEKVSDDGRRLRPVEIVQDYRHTILDELNLVREAANASQLRRNFANSPLLYVPEVFWDYTRENVMVMERIYGIPVTDLNQLSAQHTNMKKLAERGVEIFFTQVFDHNFFHADMHPGNIFVARQHPEAPQYMAVDMAIVGSLTQEDQYYLARNLLAMFRRDYRLVAELHVKSGWVPKTVRVDELESAIRMVCEPIFEKPLKDISFGNVLLSLFRTARRFDMQVQPQLVLLQKTLLNIEGLGRQLYPDLDLWSTAKPFLERWLKNRYSPKRLWREFKYHAPEWMEKFPQLPPTLFNGLQQLEQLSQLAPELERAAKQLTAPRKNTLSLLIGAAIAIAGAVAMSIPSVAQAVIHYGSQLQLSPISLILGALATALLFKLR